MRLKCAASDFVGSTEYIIKVVKAAPGARWLVGTELNPGRTASPRGEGRGKIVQFMAPMCMCSTMQRIDPHLAWTLENRITVPEHEAALARSPRAHARGVVNGADPPYGQRRPRTTERPRRWFRAAPPHPGRRSGSALPCHLKRSEMAGRTPTRRPTPHLSGPFCKRAKSLVR